METKKKLTEEELSDVTGGSEINKIKTFKCLAHDYTFMSPVKPSLCRMKTKNKAAGDCIIVEAYTI